MILPLYRSKTYTGDFWFKVNDVRSHQSSYTNKINMLKKWIYWLKRENLFIDYDYSKASVLVSCILFKG